MGTLIGLGIGVGLALILWARLEPVRPPKRARSRSRIEQALAAAGMERTTPQRLATLCLALGVVGAVVGLGLTGVPALGIIVGATAVQVCTVP